MNVDSMIIEMPSFDAMNVDAMNVDAMNGRFGEPTHGSVRA
jgi:galactitol-specific phosphotransferase system IIC component